MLRVTDYFTFRNMPADSKPSFNPTIDRIMDAANRLRALPANAARIGRMLDVPSTTETVIVELISLDQVLAGQILRLGNFEFRGQQPKSSSIPEACRRVGLARMKALIQETNTDSALMQRLSGYALEADHDFLLKGDVFTKDVLETWIDMKRSKEIDPIRLRPHPYEFYLYYDA
jgi:hypothetical protein